MPNLENELSFPCNLCHRGGHLSISDLSSSLPIPALHPTFDFFELTDRNKQKRIIWEKWKNRDDELELESFESYQNQVEAGLNQLHQRFILNGRKTTFWLCKLCEGEEQVVYAVEHSRKSHLLQHVKKHRPKLPKKRKIQNHFDTTTWPRNENKNRNFLFHNDDKFEFKIS
jgi:hypothetical protein